MLRVIVLGAAAGGGLPQWNCGCANCASARSTKLHSTQASLAVSADDQNWILINASPDLRQQLEMTPRLHPQRGQLRHSPIAAVVLTNAEVDAVAGLLSMREGSSFALYAHPQVLAVLKSNSIFNVLREDKVRRVPMHSGETFMPLNADGNDSRIEVTPFGVTGKAALYLEDNSSENGDTFGLTLRDRTGKKTVHIVTACASINHDLKARLDGADAIFFDGTLWRDDELITAGLGEKTGARMGHVAMDGESGVIARFADVEAKRKVFVHINNSNPVWRQGTAERAAAERAGWEIGYDGLEIVF